MITIVTSTLDCIPEGSVEQEYVDTLVVACRSWQADGVVRGLRQLAGDRLVDIRLDQDTHERLQLQWVYVIHKCTIMVMRFTSVSELEAFMAKTNYELKPYPGREDCGVPLAFYA